MTDYAEIKALNWSSLRHIATSPRLYRWRMEHPQPDTPSLALGRACHVGVLQPHLLDDLYSAPPDGVDGRSREAREWRASIESGVTALSARDASTVASVSDAVAGHYVAQGLLEGTEREMVIEWTDRPTGVACKGRVDAIARNRLLDLKTTRDLRRFQVHSADLLYHAQMAWYADGAIEAGILDVDAEVYIIAAETVEPHDVGVFRVPGYVLEVGRNLYRRLLGELRECERTGAWPGMHPGVTDLELPRWADPDADEF